MVALAGNNEVIEFVSELLADMDWMWDFESGLEDNIGWEAAKADSIEEIVAQLVVADKILDSEKLPVVDADLLDFGVWTADAADGFAHTLADNAESWAIHLRPRIAADFHNSTLPSGETLNTPPSHMRPHTLETNHCF